MKCLYISDTQHTATQYRDGSARYRCYNVAEELARQGYFARVAAMQDISPEILAQFDVVIFLRPAISRRLLGLVNACARKNILAVADFDDLLFRPDLSAQLPSVRNKRVTLAQATRKSSGHRDALSLFSYITVATDKLKQHARSVAPTAKIFHLPNGLSSWWLSQNQNLDFTTKRQSHLLYLPGTRSHDGDFQTIAKPLQQLLTARTGLSLKSIGPLSVKSTELDPGLLTRGPDWVEFDRLPQYIAKALACLAPLTDSEFNQCKSHIKFIEAAAFGTPLLASPIPDIQQHNTAGLFFPQSLAEWTKYTDLLADPDYLLYCGEQLQNYARSQCSNESNLPALLSFYSQDKCSKIEPVVDTTPFDYSPQSVTLCSNRSRMSKRFARMGRKLKKFMQSPRHFMLDSKIGLRYRSRADH